MESGFLIDIPPDSLFYHLLRINDECIPIFIFAIEIH